METPPPGPGNVKPQSPPAGAAAGQAGVAARPYPKPPAFFPRLALLILKPESWAAAARYPSRFTFIPLGVVIILSALAISISYGVRFSRAVVSFANHFPPMEVSSDGVLKPVGPLSEPPRFNFYDLHVIVDPLKTLPMNSVRSSHACVITDREIVFPNMSDSPLTWKFAALDPLFTLPGKGSTAAVNADSLRGAAPLLGATAFFMVGFFQFVGDVFWSILIIFFLCPLITLVAAVGERSLILPKRAAYRMAAALVIPLIAFNALMNLVGYPVSEAISDFNLRWLFWFFAASAMAVWTGLAARKMYGPTRKNITRQN